MDYGYHKEISEKDPRQARWTEQREARGFDDTELWNLDFTIARFVLPRLKAFKTMGHGYPGNLTFDEWNTILDKMIFSFEYAANDDKLFGDSEFHETVNEGMQYFADYFFHLWD